MSARSTLLPPRHASKTLPQRWYSSGSPLFVLLREALGSEFVHVEREDEEILSERLVRYLLRVGGNVLAIQDLAPFFWSYLDVDWDAERWHDRIPFVPIVDTLLSCGVVSASVPVNVTFAHMYRMWALARVVDGDARWVLDAPIRDAGDEAFTTRTLRSRWRTHAWVVRRMLHRRSSSFLWYDVSTFLYGGPTWLHVLETAESLVRGR